MDVGASTGGFTDCLLQRGAARVIAIDTGHGQIDFRIRQDARVRPSRKKPMPDISLKRRSEGNRRSGGHGRLVHFRHSGFARGHRCVIA